MRMQWSVPPLANGRSPIEYRVTYFGSTPDNDHANNVISVDTKKTTNTSVTLQLNINAIYDITVSECFVVVLSQYLSLRLIRER